MIYAAGKREDGRVAPGEIADAVGRSPSATAEMLRRLEERGLAVREPYDGATLTEGGRETAEELYGTYAVLSQFFREVIGLDDHDREAMRIDGDVIPVVTERLASTLLSGVEAAPGTDADSPACPGTDIPRRAITSG